MHIYIHNCSTFNVYTYNSYDIYVYIICLWIMLSNYELCISLLNLSLLISFQTIDEFPVPSFNGSKISLILWRNRARKETKEKKEEKIRSVIYRKYSNRIGLVEESVAWMSGQAYACLRIKGIYRVVWVPHSKAHSDGPCPTMSDMPTNRQADAPTNLFSIRPMRSKLIVPHFWYVVAIPPVSPLPPR